MKLGVPAQSIPSERVMEHFGWLVPFYSMDKAGLEREDARTGRLGADADRPHSGVRTGDVLRRIAGSRVWPGSNGV
jgi:hypothetical protein